MCSMGTGAGQKNWVSELGGCVRTEHLTAGGVTHCYGVRSRRPMQELEAGSEPKKDKRVRSQDCEGRCG